MENLAPNSGDVDKSVGVYLSFCIHNLRIICRCLPVNQSMAMCGNVGLCDHVDCVYSCRWDGLRHQTQRNRPSGRCLSDLLKKQLHSWRSRACSMRLKLSRRIGPVITDQGATISMEIISV